MDPDFSWIYLIFFLLIPLSRIIPRVISRFKAKDSTGAIQEKQIPSGYDEYQTPRGDSSMPQTKDMVVLGELNRGVKTFEKIQKNTGLENEELDMILGDLEKRGMLRVDHKQGLFGPKIELYPTDKGFKEYYS